MDNPCDIELILNNTDKNITDESYKAIECAATELLIAMRRATGESGIRVFSKRESMDLHGLMTFILDETLKGTYQAKLEYAYVDSEEARAFTIKVHILLYFCLC